jgi:integrase
MGRRRTLTDFAIAALPSKPKPYALPDPELPGLYIRVRPTGAKVFCAVGRAPSGKQIWHTIGATNLYNVTEARERAREAIKAIRDGKDRDGPETFETVADEWFKRHVQAKKLISASAFRSVLDRHFLPAWRTRDFASIRRGDVAKQLDAVEDSGGPAAADFALTVIRMICNWHQTRHENYATPIVKGMRRTNTKERARDRILDDDELRAVWKQAEANGTFGAYIRLALLTAQRREKVAAMRWEDISEGEWCIPAEARQKGTAGCLMLPEIAMEIIEAQPRFASNPYVLAGRGSGYIQGQSKRKAQFDGKVGIAPWVFHDLRRTARSLMSRAGVRSDIAERVMGHAIVGVEGVYDRHQYRDEKATALKLLASLIEGIVNPPIGNVVALRK